MICKLLAEVFIGTTFLTRRGSIQIYLENLIEFFEAEIKFIEHYEKIIGRREKNNYAECNTGSKFGINS